MADIVNPLAGFQSGLGWLQNLPAIITGTASGINVQTGLGLVLLDYGGYMILAVLGVMGVLMYMMWLGHVATRDEI